MSNPKIKFKYHIVKHFNDFCVHETVRDLNNKIIGVNGDIVSLVGYSPRELEDIINAVKRDIVGCVPLDGNCEDLYVAFDKIMSGDFFGPRENVVLPLQRKE